MSWISRFKYNAYWSVVYIATAWLIVSLVVGGFVYAVLLTEWI